MNLLQNTPTELYRIHKGSLPEPVYEYWVKREDLACKYPGPPFAKVRGLWRGLSKLKSLGIKEVGYFETSISMATWGVSYFCQELGMKAVIFYYEYKDGLKHEQAKQQKIWKKFGAEVHRLDKANMQKVQESVSKKKFLKIYPEGEFLPAGLKFDHTVTEVAKQVKLVPKKTLGGTLVICAGSGMMTAGVIKGLSDLGIQQKVIGVIVHPKSRENLKKFIIKKSIHDPFYYPDLKIVDYAYEYTQRENCDVPFPCCPYYDRKAYKWMIDGIDRLKKPILFWNIGSGYYNYSIDYLLSL